MACDGGNVYMKWRKYTIHTTTEAEDLVSMMLMELGVEGVEIEDNVPLSEADTKGMFIDILPETGPDDGTSRLSFYLHIREDEDAGDVGDGPSDGTGQIKSGQADAAAETEDLSQDASEDRSYSIADRLWTEAEISVLMQSVRNNLEEMRNYMDVGEARIEEGITEETDWRDNWKAFFKPVKAGSFLIKPTWETVPEEYIKEMEDGSLKVIEIDPGTAFGTGSHETTQLCLKAVERYLQSGDKVLDIGTGSGILGIAALKAGAGYVAATELDEQCEPSIMDNTGFNNISEEEFRLFIGNIIGDEAFKENVLSSIDALGNTDNTCNTGNSGNAGNAGSAGNVGNAGNAENVGNVGNAGKTEDKSSGSCGIKNDTPGGRKFDIVIANILAPVICMLAGAGEADSLIKTGGIFITSGIIDEKLEDVVNAFKSNPAWEILEVNEQGEWRSVIAERR